MVTSLSDLNDDCLREILMKVKKDDILNLLYTSMRFKDVSLEFIPKLGLTRRDIENLLRILPRRDALDVIRLIRKVSVQFSNPIPDFWELIKKYVKDLCELEILFMSGFVSDSSAVSRYKVRINCEFLGEVKNLKRVSFSRLSLDSKIMENFVNHNPNVEYLKIEQCQGMGPLSKLSNVKTIVIKDDHLNKGFFKEFTKMHSLRNALFSSYILDTHVTRIMNLIAATNAVEYLKITQRRDFDLEQQEVWEDIPPLKKIQFFRKITSLKSISYSNNKVNPLEYAKLKVKNAPELEYVEYEERITSKEIIDWLKCCPSLKEINCERISEDICRELETYLVAQNRSLTIISPKMQLDESSFQYLKWKPRSMTLPSFEF